MKAKKPQGPFVALGFKPFGQQKSPDIIKKRVIDPSGGAPVKTGR